MPTGRRGLCEEEEEEAGLGTAAPLKCRLGQIYLDTAAARHAKEDGKFTAIMLSLFLSRPVMHLATC